MPRKHAHPDGEESFQRVLEIIRNTPIEEYDARIARYEQEDKEAEAEYRLLMTKSQSVPTVNSDAPSLSPTTGRTPVVRRPKRMPRATAA